nr:Myc-type, basic helix-loop-helix (bHLH) domain-containing protein [Tanacetum cinerariifolium]
MVEDMGFPYSGIGFPIDNLVTQELQRLARIKEEFSVAESYPKFLELLNGRPTTSSIEDLRSQPYSAAYMKTDHHDQQISYSNNNQDLLLTNFLNGCQIKGGQLVNDQNSSNGTLSQIFPTIIISSLNQSSTSSSSSSSSSSFDMNCLPALDHFGSPRFDASFSRPSSLNANNLGGFSYGLDRMNQPNHKQAVCPSKISSVSTTGSCTYQSAKRPASKYIDEKVTQPVTQKKSKSEPRAPCAPFQVRKEKLGDRIAAIQQMVAPFGKTDTASVLMEAIGYIKFLHTQVETLSVPYMKSTNKIYGISSQGGRMEDGVTQAKRDLQSRGLCLHFDVMISLPPCTCEVAKHFAKHNQLIKLMQFLMGFDESYLAIKGNILTRETLPLVNEAFAISSGEELHRNVTSVEATKPAATTFTAKTFENKRRPNNNSNSNKGNNATTNISHVSLSNKQLSRLINLLSDNGVSSANANILVNVVDISNLGLTVGQPNGTQALITKIGELKISNGITLYDVLVVPEYTVSLLSVHKIARDTKLFVWFDDEKCNIQDLRANKTVRIANQCNGLYMFDVDNACKIVSNNYISSCYVSKTLWHQRLGHPADQVLDVLKSTLNLDSQSKSDHLFFPFKMKNNIQKTTFDSGVTKDINHMNFFDNENPKRPNDDGIISSYDDGTELSLVDQNDDDSRATSIDENTYPKGNVLDKTDLVGNFYGNSELNSEIEDLPVNTVKRSSRQTKLSASLNDSIVEGKVKYGVKKVVNYSNLSVDNYSFASSLNKSIEPTCYKDVILDSNWIDAKNAEIEALNRYHTWIITYLPANRKPIGCKWIFKIKYKANGEIKRYKARLVSKGFNQREGINFDETYSLVVKMSTVRCLIAISFTNKWPLFESDINNAFLYGDLEENVYMIIHQGFSDKNNQNKVCRLVKSLLWT